MTTGSTAPKVLIVEDSKTHLELLLDALGSRFEVDIATSIKEALEHLTSSRPDIILADLYLPDGKSLELLPRSNGGFGCPVIIISGQGHEEVAVESLKAGAFDYLVKSPETLTALPTIIERTLREWSHIQERKKAEAALHEKTVLASTGAEAGIALTREQNLDIALQRCTDALVQHLGVTFARLWLFDPTENMLELKASSGLYTHLAGLHSRIPLGYMKVGHIAAARQAHLSNNIHGDPLIEHQHWAQEQGIVSFAGYPLVRGDRLIGVLAMFGRDPMSEAVFEGLSTIADAIAIGIERFHFESAMAKANRNLKALSACNALLIHADNEEKLLHDVCRIIGEISGYRFVWVGYAEQDKNHSVTPVASFGPHKEYLETIGIRWDDCPEGRGPTGTAIRTGKPSVCKSMESDLALSPWCQQAEAHGFLSCLAIPFHAEGRVLGALSICSESKNAFDGEEIRLMTDLANNLGVGIVGIRDRAKKDHYQNLLRQTLADAEHGRDQISAILQSVTDGLLVTDQEHRIILLNGTMEKLAGRSTDQCFRQPVSTILGEQAIISAIERTLSEESPQPPLDWSPPPDHDLSPKTFQVASSPAQSKEGRQFGVITILRDVSHDREVELLKNQFISTAAHELKTPLTSVLGYAELLIHEDEFAITDPAQKKEFLHYICDKALCLSGIVDDLLDLSRIQSGRKIPLNPTDSDICTLLRRILPPYERMAKIHDFKIRLPENPILLRMDPVRIEQVMENILSNAVKYSPNGGSIKIDAQVQADHFQVSVSDQGIGMTPQQAEKIFDYFYRVDSSNTAVGGLGLGMAIAKNIIEAHDGRIWVESEPTQGSTIHFTLPMTRATQQ